MARHLFLLLSVWSLHSPVLAEIIEGNATVVDGDTIDMTGTRIRLAGIDAPEAAQTCSNGGVDWACGKEATASLAAIIKGSPVVCTTVSTDVYGRKVAQCRNKVYDLGHEQLRRGMAIETGEAPREYAEAVGIAQRMKAGIWSSSFQSPAEWRAANKASEPIPQRQLDRSSSPASVAPERVYRNEYGCTIKGNRSRRGEWIYHLPGKPYYDQTRAEELFCTESEARAAGYRRSKAG